MEQRSGQGQAKDARERDISIRHAGEARPAGESGSVGEARSVGEEGVVKPGLLDPDLSTDAGLFSGSAVESEPENPLGLDEISPPPPPDQRRWLMLSIFVLMTVAMLATALVVAAIGDRKASVLAGAEDRLLASATGRGQVLRTWLEGKVSASKRITESELVRLFVTDMALSSPGKPLPRSLRDQQPYFQQLMADFANQHGLARSVIIDHDGRILLSSPGPVLAMPRLLNAVQVAPAGWQHVILPIRPEDEANDLLVVDVVLPIPSVQAANGRSDDNRLLLILTLPVTNILSKILTLSDTIPEAEYALLLQQADDGVQEIEAAAIAVRPVRAMQMANAFSNDDLAFERRLGSGGQLIYALGKSVEGSPWTIVHAVDAGVLLAPVRQFRNASVGIAIVVVAALALGFTALWWRRSNGHHRDLVALYQALADQLGQQRRLLASITSSMSDWLAVNGPDGRYIYVNPAFASGLGRTEVEVLGRTEADLLVRATASPAPGDIAALFKDEDVCPVEIAGRHCFLSSSVSDLMDKNGIVAGTVTVIRDRTELVEQRGHRLHAIEQTVDALVQLVEQRDPFLLGHSRRLRAYGIAVGRRLDLDKDTLAALALAASLSQIGKVFIPDDILVKPTRHSQSEAVMMRSHIDHALGVLRRIDFQLPVVEILGQMHERLDGSGYPNGLSDDAVALPARILGAVDVFCARTAPRSYRDRLSPGKALYHLAQNTQRYDLSVIGVLADIAAEEGDLEEGGDLEGTFLDARIWHRAAGDHPASTNVAA